MRTTGVVGAAAGAGAPPATVPTLGEMVVNQLENSLFVAYGKKKDVFMTGITAAPKDDFDSFIKPYTTSVQEKMEETHLFSIVSKGQKKSVDFSPLPAELLETKFRLAPPKRLVQHNPGSIFLPAKSLPRQSSNISLSTQSVTSQGGANRVVPPTTTMRSRASEPALSSVPAISAPPRTSGPVVASAPANLYGVIESTFHRYWNMEFDDPATSSAFFANIHAGNAHEFHLATFAAQSCSLTIINTRIQARQYANMETFKFDMETMFTNIIKYYAENSLPHITAQQLFRQFQTSWAKDVAGLR